MINIESRNVGEYVDVVICMDEQALRLGLLDENERSELAQILRDAAENVDPKDS